MSKPIIQQSWDFADSKNLEKLQIEQAAKIPLKDRLKWIEEISESPLIKKQSVGARLPSDK